MTTALELVSEQFPLLRGRVAWRFEHDELFRELCQDYESCVQAIARMRTVAEGPEALRKEYAALRLHLETELLGYLRDEGDPAREQTRKEP